jgi:hypothetical protein
MEIMLLAGPILTAGALVWSLCAIFVWKGGLWRVLALLPWVAVLLYWNIVLVPDWRKDPTDHNLFPFEIGMLFWPSAVYMAVLALIRSRRGSAPAAA